MHRYAVVRFMDEFVENEPLVSEIPITWLHSENTMCKWPPTYESYHISRGTVPKPGWTDHRVICERVCESLQDARKKCEYGSETSSAEEVVGRRRIPNKHYSDYYMTCPSPPKFIENTNPGCSATSQSHIVDLDTGSQVEDNNSEHHEETDNATLTNYDAIQTIHAEPRMDTIVFNRGKPSSVDEKLDKIIGMLGALKMEIEDMKQARTGTVNVLQPQLDWSKFNHFPINDIESLNSLELQVKNDADYKLSLLQFLKHIGGRSGKDLHNRCFRKLFSNSLCEQMSWKGFRNNFKIEHLVVVQCLYDTVNDAFPTTLKEYEMLTRDYLRHSKQRRQREEAAEQK